MPYKKDILHLGDQGSVVLAAPQSGMLPAFQFALFSKDFDIRCEYVKLISYTVEALALSPVVGLRYTYNTIVTNSISFTIWPSCCILLNRAPQSTSSTKTLLRFN